MAAARLVAAPFPLAAPRAAARLRATLALGARPPPALCCRARPACGVRQPADAAEVDETVEPTAVARTAVTEHKASKESERRTYLVAAVMSSLGIASRATAAIYYHFAWQMEDLDLGEHKCLKGSFRHKLFRVLYSLLTHSDFIEDGLSVHCSLGHPFLFGAASYCGGDVALKLRKTSDKMEDCFDLILSINHSNKMCRDVTMVSFSTHPEQHQHVEHVNYV